VGKEEGPGKAGQMGKSPTAGFFVVEESMTKFITAVTLTLLLATSSQAASVFQKHYGYRYEAANDLGSDREYVICEKMHHSPLVPELKRPPLSLKFGNQSTPAVTPPASLSPANPNEYRLEKTILFGFDSSKVEDVHELSLLAGFLKTDPSVTGIRIKGFTCDIGSKAYNDRLAMRRALSVGSLLGRNGLQVDEVSGEGKCCYVPGEKRLSRRVEISVIRSPESGVKHEK